MISTTRKGFNSYSFEKVKDLETKVLLNGGNSYKPIRHRELASTLNLVCASMRAEIHNQRWWTYSKGMGICGILVVSCFKDENKYLMTVSHSNDGKDSLKFGMGLCEEEFSFIWRRWYGGFRHVKGFRLRRVLEENIRLFLDSREDLIRFKEEMRKWEILPKDVLEVLTGPAQKGILSWRIVPLIQSQYCFYSKGKFTGLNLLKAISLCFGTYGIKQQLEKMTCISCWFENLFQE